jgi:hypothetical protein
MRATRAGGADSFMYERGWFNLELEAGRHSPPQAQQHAEEAQRVGL